VHYGKDHISGDHIVDVVGEQVPDAYLAELTARFESAVSPIERG